MSNVEVIYSDFSKDGSVAEKITFDLLPNTVLVLAQGEEAIEITMKDADTDSTELSGTLDKETITNLIRSLTIFKNQL